MKQEDLKNLKIEDLEEVTDGHYVFGQKVILVSDLVRFSKTVFAIVKDNEHGIITDSDYYSSKIFKAYKIPKPQKREMNSLEVMEYLNHVQNYLNGVINPTTIKDRCPIFIEPKLPDFYNNYVFGKIVLKDNEEKGWCDKAILMEFDNVNTFKYAILKNGKITEFKLPQIEIKQEK